MKPIIMPQIGQDIPTGRILEWLKKENDPVRKGEVLLLVESEKAQFEIEADQDGVLLRILHEDGEEVDVFQPVAYFGAPGEQVEDAAAEPKATADAPAPEPAAEPIATGKSTACGNSTRRFASPAARRVAKERGLDLNRVAGSGPNGRVIKRDVLTAAATPAAEKVPAGQDTVEVFGKMRRRIAERMTLSKQTIPHFYLFVDVDMTDAIVWRTEAKRTGGGEISLTDLIVKAAAGALTEFQRLNAHVEADRIVLKGSVHIGLAVAVDEGLFVPVIPDAEAKSLAELSRSRKTILEAARRGSVAPHPPATFTITSLGAFGIPRFLPIINPPECAILGVGAIEKRVVPVEKGIGVRDMMTLTLACDHRGVDGAYAAPFLNRTKALLENVPAETLQAQSDGEG